MMESVVVSEWRLGESLVESIAEAAGGDWKSRGMRLG
jgi:hypothetical protein